MRFSVFRIPKPFLIEFITASRDKGPTEKIESLAEESPSPARHKGKRKKEPVEDKSAVHSLAYALHSAYRG